MKQEQYLEANKIYKYEDIYRIVDLDLKLNSLESKYIYCANDLLDKKDDFVKLLYDNVIWYSKEEIEELINEG
ncbi:hypothetical protein [Mycoplasmopsis cynos]|uniref:hypothetical protein n=1 Tax=Mycoplasmopsis cynos TaxID=171284 RepID=UPI002AFFA938|nr:hypothetical protein [Mycoplasmopsis cynos]WQQ17486.1 hypothetical protein RRG56_02920 [Mycoplasmopsis cynos]